MKRRILFSIAAISLALLLIISNSCSDAFLEHVPPGSTNNATLATKDGVNALLIGAYAGLMELGSYDHQWGPLADGPENWVFGGVCSGDATKGMFPTNESAINSLENCTYNATNAYCENKWMFLYDAVARTNDVIRVLAACDPPLEDAANIKGQALFLRGYFHFALRNVFNKIPYITESDDPATVKNDVDVWPMIEEDLKYAADNLPATQSDIGRATKWAAKSLLAKAYIFQKKWNEAIPLLDDVIANSGKALQTNYYDVFKISNRNNNEAIFAIQAAVNDGADQSHNANYSTWGINPIGVDGTNSCCGAYQPTQNLVNAYQVDGDGLPLLSGTVPDFKNDMGISSTAEFVQDTLTPVDPRLDWVVGRRGVPYLDYGIMRGSQWVRQQDYGGPYVGKKFMPTKTDRDAGYVTTTGWASSINAHTYFPIRFAHVLLWRAEAAAETNDFIKATNLVNQIRRRASNQLVMGRCRTFTLGSQTGLVVDYSVPAANYHVGEYPTFPNLDYARKAIRMEFRLEFAMEGTRRFDLVRWGIAAETINAYYDHDRTFRSLFGGAVPARFTEGKHEFFPIPQSQIDFQKGILEQNTGF